MCNINARLFTITLLLYEHKSNHGLICIYKVMLMAFYMMYNCLSYSWLHFPICQILSNLLTPKLWVFLPFTQLEPRLDIETIFLFMRYWVLCHNWDIHNFFVFDERHVVAIYLQKLNGLLMWLFCLLERKFKLFFQRRIYSTS